MRLTPTAAAITTAMVTIANRVAQWWPPRAITTAQATQATA